MLNLPKLPVHVWRFEAHPQMRTALRNRMRRVTGKFLVDASWSEAYGTVCIWVRSTESSDWKLYDALRDGNGVPRNLCMKDIDDLTSSYDSTSKPDPITTLREYEAACNSKEKDDISNGIDEAAKEQQWYDRRFGRDAPMGSLRP